MITPLLAQSRKTVLFNHIKCKILNDKTLLRPSMCSPRPRDACGKLGGYFLVVIEPEGPNQHYVSGDMIGDGIMKGVLFVSFYLRQLSPFNIVMAIIYLRIGEHCKKEI